jgi:hypothetical protein
MTEQNETPDMEADDTEGHGREKPLDGTENLEADDVEGHGREKP